MENKGDVKNASMHGKECVRVAVNVRPLITSELLIGCTHCITVFPGETRVQIGSDSFTFDYVFGDRATPCSSIFNECVAPLVDAFFKGYNGTVLAYGQTGSGKTYTMGTNYKKEGNAGGIIPQVMQTIYSRVESMKCSTEFRIRVSFIELLNDEVYDLLGPNPAPTSKGETTKASGPARDPIHIRETRNGGITLIGVTEAVVRSKEEMAAYLRRGSDARATGSTNMNSQSSRSHAIFTIYMEQKKISRSSEGSNGDIPGDILSVKLHLVDLAGSERAKRTGADGMRLKEGIHINKGLLSLGNVISALGDEKKRKERGHVPYRDSKLTRLLQDSLGGNSKTVMIACVSPADTNAEETLNTLKYANRARNIQNKAVAGSREIPGAGNVYGPGALALMQGIEHELDVIVRVHEVRSQYERQMEERTKMAQEIVKLKEEAELLKQNTLRTCSACPETMSPGARNSRICALENMLATSSSSVSMASELLEAEECERVCSGRGRWNQVHSLAEAKNLMNCLFNLASSSRCMVRDREHDCREKDSEIQDLKEKIVKLNGFVRQLEKQNAELKRQKDSEIQELKEKMVKLNGFVRQLEKQNAELKRQMQQVPATYGERGTYDLRKGSRSFGSLMFSGKSELFEDVDTSDSDHEWVHPMFIVKKRNSRKEENSTTAVWCSCSRSSCCKTIKCECRSSGRSCSAQCVCPSRKCTNREDQKGNIGLQDFGSNKNGMLPGEVEHDHDLASQGVTSLQSALAEMPAEQHEENGARRKPLADIGNTAGKFNAPRPVQRKKLRKSTIQLVPAPPASAQAENVVQPEKVGSNIVDNVEAGMKAESSTVKANIPLKLPRVMRSATYLLAVRNSEHGEEPAVHKDSGERARRSPLRRPKTIRGKRKFWSLRM